MKATLRCSQVVYGIAKQHFASLVESQAASIDGFPWISPENPQEFPWLYVDDLYVVLLEGDEGTEFDDLSSRAVCVCDGSIVADADIRQHNNATRYCIAEDSTDKGSAPYLHEFEYDGEFDVKRLTIHYKTVAMPRRADIRLVTSVEYDGRQIYSAGRIVENCEMPSAGDLLCYYTICDGRHICDGRYKRYGWTKRDGADSHAWKLLDCENARGTVVVPAFVDEIAEDAFADCGGLERLYIKEDACFDDCYLPGHVRLNCAKVPESHCDDVFGDGPEYEWCGGRWKSVSNGFFSGPEVHESEYLFKKSHDGQVRWLELRPREFQYICSLAFDLQREECDEVGGRWLFTRSLESGNLLLQLATAFMEGREVEQDFPMALRCCEQAVWCAIGDGIPFAQGDVFPGIEVAGVNQFGRDDAEVPNPPNPELVDLYERANGLKEDVLTRFQRLDIILFVARNNIGGTEYHIPDLAFEGRHDLRDILLPDELCDKHVVVGRYAFARCTNLRSITVAGMKDGFTIVREDTSFQGCDSLSDRIQYSLDGSKLVFCLNAPEECSVCSHVRVIVPYAFQQSQRMSSFSWDIFEDAVRDLRTNKRIIGRCAFHGCRNLLRVCAKGREVVIGDRAFMDCCSLSEFEFGSDATEISFLSVPSDQTFSECSFLSRVTGIGGRGYLIVDDDGVDEWERLEYLHRGDVGRHQFCGCELLRELPPVIAVSIPDGMFADCGSLECIKCVGTTPSIIMALQIGCRPRVENRTFSIGEAAFARCCSLRWFKFYRMRIFLGRKDEDDADVIESVELMEEPPRTVQFGEEAFLDCWRLSRVQSSFSGATNDSAQTAFSRCPEFEGFVERNDDEIGGEPQHPDEIDLLED